MLQEKYIEQNTAQISVDRADQQKKESANVYEDLRTENAGIEKQLEEINQGKKDIAAQLEASKQRESSLRRKTAHTVRYLKSREYLSRRLHTRPLPFHLSLQILQRRQSLL